MSLGTIIRARFFAMGILLFSLPANATTIVQQFNYQLNAGFSGSFLISTPVKNYASQSSKLTEVALRVSGDAFANGSWNASNFPENYGTGVQYNAFWNGTDVSLISDHFVDDEITYTDIISVNLNEPSLLFSYGGLIKKDDIGFFSEYKPFDRIVKITDSQLLSEFSDKTLLTLHIEGVFSTSTECLSIFCNDIDYSIDGLHRLNVSVIYSYLSNSVVPVSDTWLFFLVGFAVLGLRVRSFRVKNFSSSTLGL